MQYLSLINMVAVIGTSLLMLAVATVWDGVLSPLKGDTQTQAKDKQPLELILTGMCYLVLITLLALGDILAQYLEVSLLVCALALAIFGSVSFVALTLPLQKSLRYYAVQCGFLSTFIVASVFIVHYWPW